MPSGAQLYEDSSERAIDEFMRSPKGNARRSLAQQRAGVGKSGSQMRQAGFASASNANNSTSGGNSFKKTGVNVSKCYQMLCGRCGRRFASKCRAT